MQILVAVKSYLTFISKFCVILSHDLVSKHMYISPFLSIFCIYLEFLLNVQLLYMYVLSANLMAKKIKSKV